MNKAIHSVVVVALLALAGGASAQTPPARPFNWVRQIGSVAADPDQIRPTMSQIVAGERADFTRRVLRAINSMPASPDVKAQRTVRASVALVAAAGEAKSDVIVAIFTHCPVLYLGAVSQALSAGFDQRKNGLSDAAYLVIATNLMSGVVAQLGKSGGELDAAGMTGVADPDSVVRLTVTAATLVHAAADPVAVEAALLALMPSETRTLVAAGVFAAAIKGDYGPLMDIVGNENRMVLPVTFAHAAFQDVLLAQMDIRRSADESRFVSVGIERQWGGSAQGLFVLPIIVPGGYQDQGILEGRIFDGRIIEKVVERLLPQIDYCGNWISDPCNPNGELVQGWFFR